MIEIGMREATKDDEAFILAAWLRGLREERTGDFTNIATGKRTLIRQGSFGAFMPHDLYYKRFRPLIENRIYPKSTVIIAHNLEDTNQILGYIAFRNLGDVAVLSFCYVKQPFRGLKIATRLLQVARGKTTVATFHVPWLQKVFKKEGIIYDPFFDLEEI